MASMGDPIEPVMCHESAYKAFPTSTSSNKIEILRVISGKIKLKLGDDFDANWSLDTKMKKIAQFSALPKYLF